MLRKLVLAALLLVLAVGTYAAAPLVAAWQIREAVVAGDAARLRERVDWGAVRKSLKSSVGEARQAIAELTEAAGLPRPGLWQRFKAAALPYLADPLIDRYVTAEGAPQLYAWRQVWKERKAAMRQAVSGPADHVAASVSPEPRHALETWLEGTPVPRILAAGRRVERWAFVSPFRLQIELADRVVPGRSWHAEMQLQGFTWRLTGLKIVTLPISGSRRSLEAASVRR